MSWFRRDPSLDEMLLPAEQDNPTPSRWIPVIKIGTTVVVATHDVGLINETPGAQLIRLENGTLVDPTGALRNPPRPKGQR